MSIASRTIHAPLVLPSRVIAALIVAIIGCHHSPCHYNFCTLVYGTYSCNWCNLSRDFSALNPSPCLPRRQMPHCFKSWVSRAMKRFLKFPYSGSTSLMTELSVQHDLQPPHVMAVQLTCTTLCIALSDLQLTSIPIVKIPTAFIALGVRCVFHI